MTGSTAVPGTWHLEHSLLSTIRREDAFCSKPGVPEWGAVLSLCTYQVP